MSYFFIMACLFCSFCQKSCRCVPSLILVHLKTKKKTENVVMMLCCCKMQNVSFVLEKVCVGQSTRLFAVISVQVAGHMLHIVSYRKLYQTVLEIFLSYFLYPKQIVKYMINYVKPFTYFLWKVSLCVLPRSACEDRRDALVPFLSAKVQDAVMPCILQTSLFASFQISYHDCIIKAHMHAPRVSLVLSLSLFCCSARLTQRS